MQGAVVSKGIYAPTLRYHDGTFFMVTTNVSNGGNFIVHTKDIYGEWSEPVYIDQAGIDPSLYWENGICYFASNLSDDPAAPQAIYVCEIDPFTGEKFTRSRCISPGCGGRHPEAPHIYKINGYYYLMMAEGVTVTQCHSHTVELPYHTKMANIVVCAVGKPKMLTDKYIWDADAIIDVGINRDENGKLCGDVDFEAVKDRTEHITPVPGGVGPMTVAELMKNVVQAWKENRNV